MQVLSGSFGFFPCSCVLMAFQIGYSVEYVQVHEKEIVGHVKPLVLLAMLL